jgi:hypothetical protein
MVCNGCARFGRLMRLLLIYWKDCVVRGFNSVIKLGSAALLLIMWSCFLSLTSMSSLLYVLLCMVCFLIFSHLTFLVVCTWFLFWSCRYHFFLVFLFFPLFLWSDCFESAFLIHQCLSWIYGVHIYLWHILVVGN